MKEFIVPIEDTESMELDLQYYLYDIALECHKDPTKLADFNFFVPILSYAKKQWIVYFGSEDEVKSIDSENYSCIGWFIGYWKYANREKYDDRLIYEVVADYVCDHWLSEVRKYDNDDEED